MNDCEGCVHMKDMKEIHSGRGIVWGDSTSCPCNDCKRFPRMRNELPDYYTKFQEDDVPKIMG